MPSAGNQVPILLMPFAKLIFSMACEKQWQTFELTAQ